MEKKIAIAGLIVGILSLIVAIAAYQFPNWRLSLPFIENTGTTTVSDTENTLTRAQLNDLFGEHNWYCIGDRYSDGVEYTSARNYGVGIKQQNFDIEIAYPIRRVSSSNYEDGISDGIASGGDFGALVDFSNTLYLPPSDCPEWQLEALEKWRLDRQNLGNLYPFSYDEIEDFSGGEVLSCNSSFNMAVTVLLTESYIVQYPVMFVSGNAHRRDFGIGETVPSASFSVTLWLDGNVENCE